MGNTKTHLEREMTLKTNKLRDAISFALAVGVTTLAGTGVAFAQDTTTTTTEGDQAKTLDRIEVTGSRIKRVETETSQPVFSLSRQDIQAQGLTSVGDVIQNLSANGSALNTTFNNGGDGETRVSLRNLGSNRTLVLVNGHRWVGGTGLGGAVDLNTIPTAMVERIEVLKAGASSLYGSDAIAGVVNVILRTDYTGAEANAYLGQFSQGDGTRQSYDFTLGQSGDRFSAMFGAGYVKEEPVMAGDRPISATPTDGTGIAFGSSTIPGGRYSVCLSDDFSAGFCSVQGRPDGSSGQFTYDPGTSGTDWRARTSSDLYNFAPDNYLLTPQERKSIFGRANLQLTDDVSFFIQGTYNNRRSEQLLAPMPIVLGTGPGANTQSQQLFISKYNIYNPFGYDVSRIQRRATETGGRSFNQSVDTFGLSSGLEGSFSLGDRYFSWDAGMVYGRNDENDTTYGLFNVLALKNALGPSMLDTNGNPVCVTTPGDLTSVIPGCVPLNLLSNGGITQDMLDYSTFVAHDSGGYKMKQYYADVSGDLFQLQGGMLGFAFGVEKRTEDGFSQPDALIASGNTTGNATTPTSGGYSVKESYLEFLIPLLKDVSFAKELSFDVATRWSNYSNFGDTLNSSFGFKWRPIEDLLVRGNWAEGFRAPSILELFQGVSDSFPSISDPCSTTFGGKYNSLTPEQQARCTAQGVPPGGYDQGNAQIRISVGGNPNLQPETSTTKTLGFVWSPSFINGFDVSVDWWQINLKNAVSTPGGQFILDQCILNGIQAYCDLYTRQPSGGQITDLRATNTNIGALRNEGWDLTSNYRLPETSWGKFSFTLDLTYMSKVEQDLDLDGAITDADVTGPRNRKNLVGQYFQFDNNWRWRANLMTRWEKGDFGATWFTRYYSAQEESCPFYYNDYGFGQLCSDPGVVSGDNDFIENRATAANHIGAVTYHDVSVYWKAPWNAKVTLGVNNAFDKNPPRAFNAFANTFDPQYEVPGRFFYMQYNQKF